MEVVQKYKEGATCFWKRLWSHSHSPPTPAPAPTPLEEEDRVWKSGKVTGKQLQRLSSPRQVKRVSDHFRHWTSADVQPGWGRDGKNLQRFQGYWCPQEADKVNSNPWGRRKGGMLGKHLFASMAICDSGICKQRQWNQSLNTLTQNIPRGKENTITSGDRFRQNFVSVLLKTSQKVSRGCVNVNHRMLQTADS